MTALPALPKLWAGLTHPARDENTDEPGHRRRNYTALPFLAADVAAAGIARVYSYFFKL
jgi:hypothetical protein